MQVFIHRMQQTQKKVDMYNQMYDQYANQAKVLLADRFVDVQIDIVPDPQFRRIESVETDADWNEGDIIDQILDNLWDTKFREEYRRLMSL